MKTRSLLILSLTAAGLLARFSASALTTVLVYNSFGPGNSYSSTRWLVEGTNGPHGYQGHAEFFVPNVSGYLNQVQVATIIEGGVGLSNFYLAQDNGSGVPGTILEQFPNVPDASNGLLTFGSTLLPLLQAGQKYWLCDEPGAASTYTGWYFNNLGLTGNDAFETAPWSWFNLGASGSGDSVFSIRVVPVPEPSIAGLLVLGASVFAARTRRSS